MEDKRKHIVVLTGAGISAESGIRTFRDSNGLWEEHDIMEVASPEGWRKNRELVLKFYNLRRAQMAEVEPNAAHKALSELEKAYRVTVITQNVDDLHERAGSTNIVHLHGELTKVRSSMDPALIYEWGYKELNPGDKCEKGSQLRPHIVWFGELVPEIERAADISRSADIFMVIGTSLQVYPAAGLMHYAPSHAAVYVIDPNAHELGAGPRVKIIAATATEAVPQLVQQLLNEA
ncbi:MAG: NAD-dependent deacylase [Bacteroidia bacterium]|nr:NAD-dependent deacylase [Bacteroidia bacterium]